MAEHGVLCIQALPSGLLHGIFAFLPPRDLCAVSATCKYWRHLNQDDAANQVRYSLTLHTPSTGSAVLPGNHCQSAKRGYRRPAALSGMLLAQLETALGSVVPELNEAS